LTPLDRLKLPLSAPIDFGPIIEGSVGLRPKCGYYKLYKANRSGANVAPERFAPYELLSYGK
jgi:hypothetical protein